MKSPYYYDVYSDDGPDDIIFHNCMWSGTCTSCTQVLHQDLYTHYKPDLNNNNNNFNNTTINNNHHHHSHNHYLPPTKATTTHATTSAKPNTTSNTKSCFNIINNQLNLSTTNATSNNTNCVSFIVIYPYRPCLSSQSLSPTTGNTPSTTIATTTTTTLNATTLGNHHYYQSDHQYQHHRHLHHNHHLNHRNYYPHHSTTNTINNTSTNDTTNSIQQQTISSSVSSNQGSASNSKDATKQINRRKYNYDRMRKGRKDLNDAFDLLRKTIPVFKENNIKKPHRKQILYEATLYIKHVINRSHDLDRQLTEERRKCEQLKQRHTAQL